MIYLLGSIILTSYLTLSFKVLEKFGINNFQAIVVNYIACVMTGSVVNGKFPVNSSVVSQHWFLWSCLMGATFISLFNLIAFTAQRLGIAVASVANKLSMVIPFLFSLYLYNEKSGFLKIAGIGVALLAVILTCSKKGEAQGETGSDKKLIFFVPAILFLGSGLLDTMVKYVEQGYLDEGNKNDFLITAFAVAALIGIIVMFFQFLGRKKDFSFRPLIAGFAIGIPNYFSIWCLLKVLQMYPGDSSAIIPVNNMGIVLFSALMSAVLFKEKLSILNWAGILLSIIAIALIAYG